MKTSLYLLLSCLFTSISVLAQSVIQQPISINETGTTPDGSSLLDIQSANKGILVPRMTTIQRTAISAPATGLMVYDTDTGSFWFFENSIWNEIPVTKTPATSGVNNSPMAIPDCDPAGIASTITLSLPGTVAADMQFKVCIEITHPVTGNLDISLESPDGTSIDLSSDNGNCSICENYTHTCFYTAATNPITGTFPPYTGNWLPEESFAAFVGKTISGNWKLKVVDDECFYEGQLNEWSIQISKPSSVSTLLSDMDGDTKVRVEDVPDEDVIRFEAGGNEKFYLSSDSALFWTPVRVLGQFVSGASTNLATGSNSFAGAGIRNIASGYSSFIGGGEENFNSGLRTLVGGGYSNTASGWHSAVAGGAYNDLSGSYAFIGGGWYNNASGNYSFVGSGINLLAKSTAEAVFGAYNTNYTPVSTAGFNSADRLFVIGNGTSSSPHNAVTLLKSGYFGLGTETPDELLEVNGNILIRHPTNNGALILSPSSAGYSVHPELVIQSAENGNGGSSPFHISRNAVYQTSDDTYQYIDDSGAPASKIEFNNSGDLLFSTAPGNTGAITFSENMRILNGSGNVGIGTSTPGEKLEVAGNIFTGNLYTEANNGVINAGGGIMSGTINIIADTPPSPTKANGDEDLYIQQDLELGGQGFKPGGGSWLTASDIRLKRDIQPYTDGLTQVLQIQPVRYRYNEICNFPDPEREFIGIIAQDMLDIAPYMIEEEPFGQRVVEDEAGNEIITDPGTPYYTYDGTALSYMLVNAVQEQQTIIEEQQAEIIKLNAEMTRLQSLEAQLVRITSALHQAGISLEN